MAVGMTQGFSKLQQFVFTDVRLTGKQLGVGAYGSVEELEVNGLLCAGKRLHEALLEQDNAGVENIERRYQEECQVISSAAVHESSTSYNIQCLPLRCV